MKRVTITIKGFMFGIFGVLCIAYLCVLCLALVQFSHYVSKCLINGLCYEPLVNVVVCGAVILVLLSLVSAFRRLYRYCNNQGAATSEPTNYVAVSNHLFKDDEINLGLPCQNCKLIEMGSMACYGDKCPDCGRPPPGKKATVPNGQRYSIGR